MNVHDWFNEEERPLQTLLPDGGFCGIFRTIGCVGDSLSSGEFQTQQPDGTYRYHDMFEYSWGQFIARTIGSTVYNFSRGGMTAKEYMESFAQENDFWNPAKACQAYIVALGVNDILNQHQELGTMEDVKADWRENAHTVTGYYAAIIQRLKEIQPGAKFFLMTMLREDHEEKDALVRAHAARLYELAAHFDNCYVMDFCEYAPVHDAAFKEKFYLHGHLTPCGYALTAKMVMTYMDYIIRHHIRDFDLVGYIGREELLR